METKPHFLYAHPLMELARLVLATEGTSPPLKTISPHCYMTLGQLFRNILISYVYLVCLLHLFVEVHLYANIVV